MSEKVKIGILSTASIVGKVLPGLKHGMEVVSVASRDRQKAQDFCTTHDCGVGMLYDEMLERDDVDVLYIPLPTGLRNEKIAKAISRGKHIYSEKPMGGTASELSELLKLCEEKGLQWMDGTMWYHSLRRDRWTPKYLSKPNNSPKPSFQDQGDREEAVGWGAGSGALCKTEVFIQCVGQLQHGTSS